MEIFPSLCFLRFLLFECLKKLVAYPVNLITLYAGTGFRKPLS
jgi:hypothetical protein